MKTMSCTLMFTLVLATALSFSNRGLAQQQDGDVLAGPKVEEDASKGSGREMIAPQGQNAERRRANDLPLDQWMNALRGLSLSEKQQDSIRSINQEFQKAQQDYRASLSQEDQDAMQQVRQGRQFGSPPSKEFRERLQRIEMNRPKATEYQERIWDQLTSEQQEQMKARLAEMREQMAQRRERRQERKDDRAPNDDSMMTDQRQPAAEAEAPGSQEQMASPEAEAPRNSAQRGNRARWQTQLDEMARRRIDFLLKHQSKSIKRPGREPSPEERRFEFDEE